ncbi:MAG: carboxymuconolactone decarboxylase family protein [Pseudolactococcus laudensis]
MMKVSKAIETFAKEAPEHQTAWLEAVQKLDQASALDKKTEALVYLAVLAVMRLESGIPFHVKMAQANGATREEIISSLLIGLPAAGNGVLQALPIALEALDE